MTKMAVVRPATVGLIASASSFGVLTSGASAGPSPVAIPAVATEAANEHGGLLIPVHDGKRHHRHKHRHPHHHHHFHGHNERVVIVEREHYVPVHRERVEHYHYVERPRPYLFDPLSAGIFFIFSFDGSHR